MSGSPSIIEQIDHAIRAAEDGWEAGAMRWSPHIEADTTDTTYFEEPVQLPRWMDPDTGVVHFAAPAFRAPDRVPCVAGCGYMTTPPNRLCIDCARVIPARDVAEMAGARLVGSWSDEAVRLMAPGGVRNLLDPQSPGDRDDLSTDDGAALTAALSQLSAAVGEFFRLYGEAARSLVRWSWLCGPYQAPVEEAPAEVDPQQRALEHVRTRNTGPAKRPRAPRRIDPRRAR